MQTPSTYCTEEELEECSGSDAAWTAADSYSDDFEDSSEESEDDECARKRTPTENGVTGDSDKNDILQVLQRIRSMRAAVEGTLISP